MKFITCTDVDVLKESPLLETDVCATNKVQLISTCCVGGMLICMAVVALVKFRQRCYKTLLKFHSLRSAIVVCLLVINTLELGRACLPLSQQFLTTLKGVSNESVAANDSYSSMKNNYTDLRATYIVPLRRSLPHILFLLPGLLEIWNAVVAICFTLVLLTFHRIIELKCAVGFLYASVPAVVYISFVRFYKLSEITFANNSIYEMEAFVQCSSGLCLFLLSITDAYTIYKQRNKPLLGTKKSSDEDERNIGYKHTYSTFYSKIIFWWLTPLLWQGYKEPLEQEQLGHMREEDSARAFYDQFLIIYKTASAGNKHPSLWLCYLKSSWPMFTLGGLLKFFGDLTALVGPISIDLIVSYVEQFYKYQSDALMMELEAKKHNVSMTEQQMDKTFLQIANLRRAYIGASYPFDQGNYSYNNHYDHQEDLPVPLVSKTDIVIYHPCWADLLSNGWAIAWFVFVASLAQGTLSQASTHILNMTGIRIKTSLQGLIYRKTLLLSSSCSPTASTTTTNSASTTKSTLNNNQRADDGKVGQVNKHNHHQLKLKQRLNKLKDNGGSFTKPISCENDVGAVTNLMSEDTLNIMSFFWIAHYVWAIPLKIGVVIYLLYMQLGESAIIGSFVCILTLTPLQFLIGKAMSNNSEIVAKCTDERLKKTHDVLCGIKIIKLNAWEKVFGDKIRTARNMELKYLNKDSFYWTLMTFLTHASTVLITFVTLAVYVKMGAVDDDISINNTILSTTLVASNGSNISANIRQSSTTMMNKSEQKVVQFTASRLFSALALFNQLTVPLLIFPITVPIIISAIVSTRRLEKFLREREVQKQFEGIRHMARILSKSDASLDMYEENEMQRVTPTLPPPYTPTASSSSCSLPSPLSTTVTFNSAIQLPNNQPSSTSPSPPQLSSPQPSPIPVVASSTENLIKHDNASNGARDAKQLQKEDYSTRQDDSMEGERHHRHHRSSHRASQDKSNGTNDCQTSPKKHKDLIRSSRIERFRSKHPKLSSTSSLQFQAADNLALFVKNGLFSWANCNTMLRIDSLEIPKGRLTLVVGKSGSGKSSLLGALLMEMQQISGEIVWNKFATIAYVPQVPWLQHASIRENILFGESFRPKRYNMVLESCALKPDIELMPKGDMTIIGERGINLSGGQRQRIAIARSLYSSANVVIMDDSLSSLDNEVSGHVFERSIRKMLLNANRTVILVTQRLQLIHNADYIVVMKDGCMQAAGSYKDIEANHPKIVDRWKSIITMNEKDKLCRGRTASERWKLFKNITKLGLQRLNTSSIDNEQNFPSLPSVFYCKPKKRSSFYRSRHLIYDMPIPIDECQNDDVIIRRRNIGFGINSTTNGQRRPQRAAHSFELKRYSSVHKKEILRVHSLQPELQEHEPTPPPPLLQPSASLSSSTIMRNISFASPEQQQQQLKQNSFEESTPLRGDDLDLKSSKIGFQQFLHRMSSRKSNQPKTPTAKNHHQHQLQHHRPVSETNSIVSISEEPISSTDVSARTSWMDDEPELVKDINPETLTDANDNNVRVQVPNDDERKYGEIPAEIYMLYLKSAGLPIVVVFFTTALIWQGLRVYTDIWLQRWTDTTTTTTTTTKISNSTLSSVSKVGVGVGVEVMYYFRTYAIISSICILMALITTPMGQIAGCNARRLLHDKLLQSILTKSLHFFQITPIGRIMNRFSNDMAIIDKKIAATSQRLLQFMLLCLCAILINVSITPWFVLLTLPICTVYYIIQKFYRCSSRELQRIENMTNSPVISHLSETIEGAVTIRAYSQEARFTEKLFKHLEANNIAFTLLNTSNRWLGIALDYLGAVIVFVAILTALVAATISTNKNTTSTIGSSSSNTKNNNASHMETETATTHGPTPSLVGLAINYTLLVPIYLNWVVKLYADMEMYVGSVERVAYYAEQQHQQQQNQQPRRDNEETSSFASQEANHVNPSTLPLPSPPPLKSCQDEVICKICTNWGGCGKFCR
ncbi:ATP-binding cassette sub-family C member Sur isoform X2 [Eupeodes corollae]|uniref:ATP-binding cassette sub-family C member Sur isoform X2 n=1 Tax=Eupeodes corollae TaxID=290404 RepID=UPI0024938C9B|nr:ATP-binding cassette sub-family C member Sur isoform X2 [Eupeodes corollae]